MIMTMHVDGENRGKIFLYALSTCVWCKKVKNLLNTLGIEYTYIDVDLTDGDDKEKIKEKLKAWNPRCSFPTLVINEEQCIVGFKEDEIRGALHV